MDDITKWVHGLLTDAELTTILRREAHEKLAPYPQYAGFFDDHQLVQIVSLKGLRARAKRQWAVGQISIGKMDVFNAVASVSSVNVWHAGSGWNCLLPVGCVSFLKRGSLSIP